MWLFLRHILSVEKNRFGGFHVKGSNKVYDMFGFLCVNFLYGAQFDVKEGFFIAFFALISDDVLQFFLVFGRLVNFIFILLVNAFAFDNFKRFYFAGL